MSVPPDRIGRLARPAAVLAATAAWVVGALLNGLTGGWFVLTTATGAVLTAVAVGLPLVVARRAAARAGSARRLAEDAAARVHLVLNDALEPLAYLLGRITDLSHVRHRPQVPELQGQATALMLASAAEVLDAERLRACYFALVEGRQRALAPAGFHGRAEPSRREYQAGTPLGDAALGLLDTRQDLFCADTLVDPPPGWTPEGHAYRTFLVVPVATEDHAFGIITVDGLQVGDLAAEDVTAVRVFARLLAVALNA